MAGQAMTGSGFPDESGIPLRYDTPPLGSKAVADEGTSGREPETRPTYRFQPTGALSSPLITTLLRLQ